MLQEAEDWFYSEEGEDATKSVHVARLDALKVISDPITARWTDAEECPHVIAELRTSFNDYFTQATSADDEYAHIDDKDKMAVVEKCVTIQKWLEDQIARKAKNEVPVLKVADVVIKREEVVYFVIPILTKLNPMPRWRR